MQSYAAFQLYAILYARLDDLEAPVGKDNSVAIERIIFANENEFVVLCMNAKDSKMPKPRRKKGLGAPLLNSRTQPLCSPSFALEPSTPGGLGAMSPISMANAMTNQVGIRNVKAVSISISSNGGYYVHMISIGYSHHNLKQNNHIITASNSTHEIQCSSSSLGRPRSFALILSLSLDRKPKGHLATLQSYSTRGRCRTRNRFGCDA
jgi:hypothetical protein